MTLTALQCRLARTVLNWSQQRLADEAQVQQTTILQFERGSDARRATIDKLRSALEAAGVAFIGSGEASLSGGPSVRLRKQG